MSKDKKVLVIEPDGNTALEDYLVSVITKICKSVGFNVIAPGDLLAEVKGKMLTGDGDNPIRVFLPKDSDIRGEKVTVLILTSTDAGSEVKK